MSTPIPETMFGVVLTGHGGLDKLEWRDDLPVPKPERDEVLIRVHASSVNNTDINTRTAWYSKSVRGDTASAATGGASEAAAADGAWSGQPIAFPLIQGADCCGEIVAVGGQVPRVRIGERVLVRALQSVQASDGSLTTSTLGTECDGAFAEYTKIKVCHALPIRSDWTDLELASIPCAYSTAEAMLQKIALGAERVLITGASGGVGLAAVQLAKRRGAAVTAMTSADKAEALRALGADATISRDGPLPGNAFDAVVDVVAGPRWPELIDALKPGGRYVVAGAIAGPIVELDVRTLYLHDLTLYGSTRQPDGVFRDLVGYIERGELRPCIAEVFDLKDIKEAQTAFLGKGHVGKIVLQVAR
ncbi:alcohol dehydrogenase family protein [Thiorhodococcus minor]|uniref:Zinc-binding dehydrogenase n=1 Tax=Thiorhodococcus minor TaxID=57489 RepID=A0A6M0K3Z8_9GAMM|nr:alcohol dehydrogenase family protein [Thiorhodococcus minor]NEV63974.1 zinc-binding dehydrogenase [Thiorhodococcus minor]